MSIKNFVKAFVERQFMRFYFHLEPEKYKDYPSYIIRFYSGLTGPVATFLHKIHVSANFVTAIRGMFVVYALYCFSSGEYSFYIQGSILLFLNQFLDAVDGHLARLNKQESLIGEWLEMITGNPLAAIHGLVGFSIAWGIYKHTSMVEVWYVLFFIPYAVIMNMIFSSFSIHETDDVSTMQQGFQDEYNRIMKYSFFKKLYFNILYIDEIIILLCVIFYYPINDYLRIHPLFLALILICSILQIKWLLRILLQLKFLVSNKEKNIT